MDTPNPNRLLSKSESWRMFDEISPRYDFLNHFLSFGMDARWRRQLTKYLTAEPDQRVLDLATGTADVLMSLFKHNPNIKNACGIDLAEKMMRIGRTKIARNGLERRVTLHSGDAHRIPFNDRTFDAVTIAFGIRNMEVPSKVLAEMHRVLSAKGRALILEFSLPPNAFLRACHLAYLRHMVPVIGALFSGNYRAYKYLNRTIETFSYGAQFCSMMAQAGFTRVKAHPLLFGVATIYQGDKT